MPWQSITSALHRKWNRPPRTHQPDPFFALSLDPLCTTTLAGHLTRVNPAFTKTLGHTETALLALNVLDLLHPEDHPAAAQRVADLPRGISIAELESRFRCADGSYKWLVWSSAPSLAEGLAYTVAHDRTRRKLEEEALRQSEARCISALECTTDAFFAVDPAWRLIRINGQAERLWMCKREEVLGRNLWELFPEATGGPFHQLYEQAMRTGEPAEMEEFYPHAPHNRWFEVHAYPWPEGLAVYFRDATERHLAEDKIKRSLLEKEVLLREVHHRVKNNLQIICSMLRLQARYLQDENLLQSLRDCRERVVAMALLHDQLHRAKDLSNINLGEYIRSLVASLFCSYGVNSADVALRLDIDDITAAMDIAIPCGLIVNELVSNSLRHAFPEGKGTISLGLHAGPNGLAELLIRDDGCGFPEADRPANPRSLGLWLVDLLAEQIEATIKRSSNAGALYRLVFQTNRIKEG
jgi:PAS domain S-box-containing protein